MKGLHWKLWVLCLSVFVIGVLFDLPMLRVVGGSGTIVWVWIALSEED